MVFMRYIRYILFIWGIAFAVFPAGAQAANPFLDMTGKEYGQYHEQVFQIY